MSDLAVRHDFAERRADLLRERLSRTMTALSRRRQDLLDVRREARRHPAAIVLLGASIALSIAYGLALAKERARHRPDRLSRERVQALGRLWRHPERVARPGPRLVTRAAVIAVMGTVVAGAAGVIAMTLVRRGVRRALG